MHPFHLSEVNGVALGTAACCHEGHGMAFFRTRCNPQCVARLIECWIRGGQQSTRHHCIHPWHLQVLCLARSSKGKRLTVRRRPSFARGLYLKSSSPSNSREKMAGTQYKATSCLQQRTCQSAPNPLRSHWLAQALAASGAAPPRCQQM